MSDVDQPSSAIGSRDVDDLSGDLINREQLRLIEAVHRGFLYQHLYAVGCLLTLAAAGGSSVRVERDEDIEVVLQDVTVYLQIKTRAGILQRADVAGALVRFDKIRREHSSGRRPGTAEFRIVANCPPSASLLSDLNSSAWPSDVQIRWPDGPAKAEDDHLPPPWPDLAAAIVWCREAAFTVPFAAVTPKTLVWKLAALVLFAATGCDQEHPSHTFNTAELPLLFEQVIEQLQKFPSVPDDYRPQKEEPVFESQKRVRIMIGLSGAGKTTWAAQVARHSTAPAVYFDAGDTPPSAVASSLARELSARFLSKRVGAVGSVILPASSGMEMLRALDRRIEETPAPVVVIDNAHRVVSRHLCEIAEACSHFRFILLAQPWPALTETEALFEEEGEWLNGWDADTVAAEFHDRGCRIDPPTAERWRITTAGMPFFVRNAARLTVKLSGGDSARFLKEIDREAHTTATAQELVLSRVVDVLDQDAKTALAILSLCAAPLSREEVDVLLRALPALTDKAWGRALRQLSAYGILQSFSDGRLKVHNAMGIPARSLQSDLPPGTLLAGQTALRGLLLESFRKAFDFTRFSVWLRLLPATGGLEELVGIATEEFSMRLATRLI